MAASNRPLWQWSACDLAEAIAARRVTAVEAVGRAVDRMRATNGKINAVVDDLGEAALREAEAHDKATSAGGPIGPLHGVPVTIKENVDQKGCTTPNGASPSRE
jgi:amidase